MKGNNNKGITIEFFNNLPVKQRAALFESKQKQNYTKNRQLFYGYGRLDVSFPISLSIDGRRFYHPAYSCWQNMLKRAYYTKNTVSYNESIVCDEWLLFSNFLVWWHENYIPDFELDKDIGSCLQNLEIKTYGPQTSQFIPKWLNLIHRRKRDGNLMAIRQVA